MTSSNLDAIVQPAADQLIQHDIERARQEVEIQIHHSPWNMNQRLNMIAYEDQA
ncbi:hypothetical protein [Herbaspirillum sp. YR522]|uniref:hypothetical protein n=1 Tax=Herbaspirillum sp. YR522 TaxID=1144342 RepID=UPI00026F64CA|nr:hypothetical protein [Herbaspirillum sp. YR522]EJN09333.1 hypothetical protein PMI40_00780 [Herbaspirillum sp. YR522]